jgi:uncharacterized membrane protein SpoIIM required for sporulation
MSDEVRTLLAAVQEIEEERRRYSRRAALLELLYLVLLMSAMASLFLGAVIHLLYGYDHRPPFVISAMLWIAGYASYILYVIYDSKTAETARQACELRCMLELEMKRPVSAERA